MTIISAVEGLKDVDATRKRLLRNPGDMAAVFAKFYGEGVANNISALITQHLLIADQLVGALKAGDSAAAEEYNRQWYNNADEIAKYFASVSPVFDENMIKKMFYTHLDLTKKEAADRIAGKYQDDINDYDEIEKEALKMADYFSSAILSEFPG